MRSAWQTIQRTLLAGIVLVLLGFTGPGCGPSPTSQPTGTTPPAPEENGKEPKNKDGSKPPPVDPG